MNEPVVLDSGPVGRLVHPRLNTKVSAWLDGLLAAGVTVYLAEIVDYEVRRGLLAANMARSLQRLDQFKAALPFLPINSEVMLEAAELWANARRGGYSVAESEDPT
ncbi:MAG: hypothetical protein FD138_2083 [Planctomycetota bacterium]|nr:MAG: hypothetical protein FD138_2083 [Planctomycetota bacterium]